MHYPKAPCSLVSLSFISSIEEETTSSSTIMGTFNMDSIKENTASWVDNFLSKYRLCPYTASVQSAAVGLNSVGVQSGPVSIIVV
eukprot:9185672-Ditylum_brightwellii.AAC.1